MSKENPTREEQLFIHLISSYVTAAWVSLGKLKNPMTDKIERDLVHASFSLDMLDMIIERTEGNLEEWESKILKQSVTDLKLNYMEELKNDEKSAKKPDSDETSGKEATKTEDTTGQTEE